MIAAVNMTANTSLVWPCPLPYPEVLCPGPCGSDAWLRKRINLVVASLSWLALGSPARPPTGFGKGRPLSPKQWEAVRSLERLACDRSLTFKLDPALMGRAASKAEDHNKVLAALGRAVSSFESSAGYFAPSGRAGSARTPWPRDFSAEDALPSDSSSAGFASPAPFGQQLGNLRVPPFCPAKPIQADRLRFPPPPSFDPRPYLDKPTAARFERPLDFACVASSDVSLPRVGILASVDERLKLLRTLAQTGRLQPIMPLPQREPVGAGLFAVVKDLTRDRLILDARPANALESPPCFWTGSLASAAALLPILLGPEEEIRISSADLKDFFYLFKVSEQRLQRNLLSGSLGPSEATFVFGSRQRAFEDSKGFLRVALSTLAMGDSSACEFAQGSHLGVLFRHGVLRPDELLCPTSAPPRGLLTIGVVIDDFVILEKVTRSELRLGGRQSLGLERAHAAYAEAGLLANPEKGAKDESVSSFWGVTLDGRRGLVRASLARVGPLTCITCRVALLGLCTRPLLESLVARPAPPHRPHRPHRPTKTAEAQKLCAVQPANTTRESKPARKRMQEKEAARRSSSRRYAASSLMLMCVLGQLAVSFKERAVGAVGVPLASGDSGPFDTWLAACPELQTSDEEFRPELIPSKLRPCAVYTDRDSPRGALALTYELRRSKAEDLDDPHVRSVIEELVEFGVFDALGAAPVCSSFSRAVHPPWRSRAFPRGLPGLGAKAFQKVKVGNAQSAWLGSLIKRFTRGNSKPYWAENPDGSYLWLLLEWSLFGKPASQLVYRFDMCRYGTRWRKRTRLATNTELAGARAFCKCGGPHQVLRGRSARLVATEWSSVFEAAQVKDFLSRACEEEELCTVIGLEVGAITALGGLSEVAQRRKLKVFGSKREFVVGPKDDPCFNIDWAAAGKEVVNHPKVRELCELAAARGGPRAAAATQQKASVLASELAASVESRFAHFTSALARFGFQRLYSGLVFEREQLLALARLSVRAREEGRSIIYLPSHKSHIDYIVLQFSLFNLGMGAPAIAAGENLNLPVVGGLLRRNGAFYIRRSFSGPDSELYTAVVAAYIEGLLRRGANVKFFTEGGRSRSGKLLQPKIGLLGMVLDPILAGVVDDAYIVPVSIYYDGVMETESYVRELSGSQKRKESLIGVLGQGKHLLAMRRSRYGNIHVRFAPGFSARSYIDNHMAVQRQAAPNRANFNPVSTMADKQVLLKALAYHVLEEINRVSSVTPTALVGTVLLCTLGRGIGRKALINKVDWLRREVVRSGGHMSRFYDFPGELTMEVVDSALTVLGNLVQTFTGLVEPVYCVAPGMHFELSYYRNMCVHVFIHQAIVTAVLHRVVQTQRPDAERVERADVMSDVRFLSRLLKREFVFSGAATPGGLPPKQASGEHWGQDIPVALMRNFESALELLVAEGVVDVCDTASKGGPISLEQYRRAQEMGGYENWNKHFTFLCSLVWPLIESYWLVLELWLISSLNLQFNAEVLS
ncbi:plsB [Symbiodinium pilosum]|uniref:PlsB protein n=1 Tax=Symbiodinium pilosum TaxID=2952 RepID=A0A812UWF5_SYMPI|nr:plsB [Symbiodinium pilosum]